MHEEHPRISREERTVRAMVHTYREDKHERRDGLCTECDELLQCALRRLENYHQEGSQN